MCQELLIASCVAQIRFESAESKIRQAFSNPCLAKIFHSAETYPMKYSLPFLPTQRIAQALALIVAVTAACTSFSACAGPAYRHQARVENRIDRRQDRIEDRIERRQDRWNTDSSGTQSESDDD
jgi:hypothetical protein